MATLVTAEMAAKMRLVKKSMARVPRRPRRQVAQWKYRKLGLTKSFDKMHNWWTIFYLKLGAEERSRHMQARLTAA